MSAPTLLLKLKVLKTEEKKISETLGILKQQLTKLKVEEFSLGGKIRELQVKEVIGTGTQASSLKDTLKVSGTASISKDTEVSGPLRMDVAKEIPPDSDEVNKEVLDLTSNDLLKKLAAGGVALLQNQIEEEEENADDDDDIPTSHVILTSFLAQ